MIDWSTCSAVERDPERVGGAWVFRGPRIPVSALFENLEDGAQVSDFVQWFPGVKVPGVKGADPGKMCGCQTIGGPGTVPHVHTAHNFQTVLVNPGDWIVAEPNGDGYYPIKDEIMRATYEPAD